MSILVASVTTQKVLYGQALNKLVAAENVQPVFCQFLYGLIAVAIQ